MKFRCRNKLSFAIHLIINVVSIRELSKESCRLQDPEGKPPGVMGWWPSRSDTFVENHDTGSTQV